MDEESESDGSDPSHDDSPQMAISEVLDRMNTTFPALDFHQYLEPLCREGVVYLAAAVHFDFDFYVKQVGMSKGAAVLFCEQVTKMKKKNDRVVAGRKAKRLKWARSF